MPCVPVNRYPPQHVAIQKLATTQYKSHTVAVHEVLVKFKAPPSEAVLSSVKLNTAASYLEPIGGAGWYDVKSPTLTVAQLIQMLTNDDRVLKVEPDYVGNNTAVSAPRSAHPMMSGDPSDPDFTQQWALKNTGQCYGSTCGIASYDVNAEPAWAIADADQNRTRQIVVIYGTGVDYNNPDLAANVWTAPHSYTINEFGITYNCPQGAHGYNAMAGLAGCTGQVYDNEGHGTLVSGAADAVSNNSVGIAGTADNMTLLPISICTQYCDVDSAIRGLDASIQIAQQFGLRFAAASMSHADLQGSAFEDEMALVTADTGVVFAASTGDDCSTPGWPAAYHLSDEIAVAASDQDDNPSNWGPGQCTDSGGDIAAPGTNVLTTTLGDTTGNNPALFGGTSASAPIVAGAVALLESVCPLSPYALIATVEGTADQKPQLLGYATDGRRLNMGTALASCTQGTAATDTGSVYSSGRGRLQQYTDFGYVSITVGDYTCGYSYNTAFDTSQSMAEGLVGDCLSSPYITATYTSGGGFTLTTKAIGPYTNYPAAAKVVDQCTNACGPAPTINLGTQFTGGAS